MTGKLYVVATPIGNLDDLTPRAARVLAEADLIAAEDTRHSRVLLTHFEIRTPLVSCHKFNEAGKVAYFLDALRSGKNIALISDAGTPCLSDPGHRLVGSAAEAGVEVIGICGANAAVTALSISGFEVSAYVYLGFLPRAPKSMAAVFEARGVPGGLPFVFYESPLRIAGTIGILAECLPQAALCLCNDLTKRFERIYRGTPEAVLAALAENPAAKKGEYTCVVDGAPTAEDTPGKKTEEANVVPYSMEAQLIDIMVKQGGSLKSAIQTLHDETPRRYAKKEIYAASLRLKEMLQYE